MKKEKILKIVIFAVVLLIPIIYSFFYLKSYWNPYGDLKGLKIAVVNLDDGENNENQGNEFLKSLQDDIVYIEFSDEIPQYEIIGLSNIERWFKENGNEIFTLHLPAIPIEDVYFQFRTGKREMRKESSQVIQEKVHEISEKKQEG